MAIITTTLNSNTGVVTGTISPAEYTEVPGLGGAVFFTSQADLTQPSVPVTIALDQPVQNISLIIQGVGATPTGHTAAVYDAGGNLLSIHTTSTIAGILSPGDSAGVQPNGSPFGEEVFLGTLGNRVVRVVLTPINGQTVAYTGVVVNITVPLPDAPIAPPTPSPPVAPPPAPVPVSTVNLTDIVQISVPGIQRTYVKGTLTASDPAAFTVTNISSIITVQVTIAGLRGITFDPTTFSLSPLGVQNVIATFDGSQEELLPEGTNIINAVLNLTSNTPVNQ